MHEFSLRTSCSREKASREMKSETNRIFFEVDEKFSLILEQSFRNTNFELVLVGVSRN